MFLYLFAGLQFIIAGQQNVLRSLFKKSNDEVLIHVHTLLRLIVGRVWSNKMHEGKIYQDYDKFGGFFPNICNFTPPLYN